MQAALTSIWEVVHVLLNVIKLPRGYWDKRQRLLSRCRNDGICMVDFAESIGYTVAGDDSGDRQYG